MAAGQWRSCLRGFIHLITSNCICCYQQCQLSCTPHCAYVSCHASTMYNSSPFQLLWGQLCMARDRAMAHLIQHPIVLLPARSGCLPSFNPPSTYVNDWHCLSKWERFCVRSHPTVNLALKFWWTPKSCTNPCTALGGSGKFTQGISTPTKSSHCKSYSFDLGCL